MDKLTQAYMRNLWRWKCGLEEEPVLPDNERIDVIEEDYWREEHNEFIQYMKNRLYTGMYRYGRLTQEEMEKRGFSNISHSQERIEKYLETHNKEYLIDVANGALLEFLFPCFDDAEFIPMDRED